MLPIRALRKEARATLVAIGTESLTQLDAILGAPGDRPPMCDCMSHGRSDSSRRERPPKCSCDTSSRRTRARSRTRILRAIRPVPARPIPNCPLRRGCAWPSARADLGRDVSLARPPASPWRRTPPSSARHPRSKHAGPRPVDGSAQTPAGARDRAAVSAGGPAVPERGTRAVCTEGSTTPVPRYATVAANCWSTCSKPPLQGAVLALVDDIADADRLARAQPYYRIRPS